LSEGLNLNSVGFADFTISLFIFLSSCMFGKVRKRSDAVLLTEAYTRKIDWTIN
jgi:hypothetical protein